MNNTERFDVYQEVTDRIIEQLEKGCVPWQKPWSGVCSGAFNRITKKPYSLLNQMLLKYEGEYATFMQWKALGGTIKKGAKSEIVVFWKIVESKKEIKVEDSDGFISDALEVKKIPVLRYYRVFHISQVEGVEPLKIKKVERPNYIEIANRVIENYCLKDSLKLFKSVSDRAFYRPSTDEVHVPMAEQFADITEYYSTLFHELTHSTKHQKRLNRNNTELSFFGSSEYSKEELVAEIGSANMLNVLGISTEKAFNNSASYISSWLEVLKNNKKFIVSASSQAQKATEYILKFTEDFESSVDSELMEA